MRIQGLSSNTCINKEFQPILRRHLSLEIQSVLKVHFKRVCVWWVLTNIFIILVQLQLETKFAEAFLAVDDLGFFRMETDEACSALFHVAFNRDFNMAISGETNTRGYGNNLGLNYIGKHDVAIANLQDKIIMLCELLFKSFCLGNKNSIIGRP